MKNYKNTRHSVRTQLACCVRVTFVSSLLLVGSLMSSAAQAEQFGVRVLDPSGIPVSGASVCIGLPGNYKQFGSGITDSDGLAIMVVPNTPLVITVSKTRFSGLRISEPARGYNLVKDVVLREGVPGPHCRADSLIAAEAPPSIQVGRIDVIETPFAMSLQLEQVTGNPSHYRVSGNAEFGGSNWQAYKKRIVLPMSLVEQGQIFLQIRRMEGSRNSWLEARSAVVEVSLPLDESW